MFKQILENSIRAMKNDNKIIRITLITSFFHSMMAVLLLIINMNSLLAKHYENGLYVGKVAQYFIQEISKNHFISTVIGITIVLFVIYSITYPIGQSAIIHYIHDKGSIRQALRKGLKDLFAMYELGVVAIICAPIVWILFAFKMLIINWDWSLSTVIWLGIWLIVINAINNLKVYTRYFVVIEKKQLYEALKSSVIIATKDLKHTLKYMRIQTILLLNFSLNMILIGGIPFLIIYGAIALDIMQYTIVKVLVYVIFGIMVLAWSYISAIIRAFFVYFWYEIYHITKKEVK